MRKNTVNETELFSEKKELIFVFVEFIIFI